MLLTVLTSVHLINDDTALAVLLTSMFSIGVVLVSRRSSFTSDLTAFLFGRLLTVGPAELVQTAVVTAVVVPAATGRLPSADGGHRHGRDRSGRLSRAGAELPGVSELRAVGTILALALVVAPAAAARLWTDRLVPMTGLAMVIGIGSALGGLWLSSAFDVAAGGRSAC